MGTRERFQSRPQICRKLRSTRGGFRTQRDEPGCDAKEILDPVIYLTQKEILLSVGMLALGDVMRQREKELVFATARLLSASAWASNSSRCAATAWSSSLGATASPSIQKSCIPIAPTCQPAMIMSGDNGAGPHLMSSSKPGRPVPDPRRKLKAQSGGNQQSANSGWPEKRLAHWSGG
jgi:hypothetical protein